MSRLIRRMPGGGKLSTKREMVRRWVAFAVGLMLIALIVRGILARRPGPTSDFGGETARLVHDFGKTIGDGGVLTHVFRLRMPGDRPTRILDIRPSSPCCSLVGDVPSRVEAGGHLAIRVWSMRIPRRSGW